MQNNNIIQDQLKKNSNNVFMSEELGNLFSSNESQKESLKASIKIGEEFLEKDIVSKTVIDNLVMLKFYLSLEDIIRLETNKILKIEYKFKGKAIKTYSNKESEFQISWIQLDNKYEADIFINKRGA